MIFNIRTYPVIIILLITNLYFFDIWSQSPLTINYTVKDSLPSNEVYDIYQDKNGILWFATDNGICSYDGHKFTKYNKQDGLTDRTVFRFFPQEDGNIWCSTFNNKIFYFNPDHIEFVPYQFNNVLSSEGQVSVIDDLLYQNKHLYVSYVNRTGTICIDPNGVLQSKIHRKTADPVYLIIERTSNDKTFRSLAPSLEPSTKNGIILSHIIYSKKELPSLFYSNIQQIGKYSILSYNMKLYLKIGDAEVVSYDFDKTILNVGKYDSNHFWVSFLNGGIKIFNFDGKLIKHLFKNHSVSFYFKDHQNKSWYATLNNGLTYVLNEQIVEHQFQKGHLITKVAYGCDNNIWLMSNSGEILKREQGLFKSIYTPKDLSVTPYSCYDDTRLLKRDQESFFIIYGSRITFRYRRIFYPPKIKNYTVSKHRSSITKSTAKDIFKTDSCHFLATNEGLIQFTPDLKTNLIDLKEFQSPINNINNLQGELVLSTTLKGLVFYSNKTPYSIDTKQGLASNYIEAIEIENNNRLWVATDNGLNLLTRNSNKEKWTVNSIEFFKNIRIQSITQSPDSIWVASSKGLFSFHKNSNIEANDLLAPNLYLKLLSIEVKGELLTPIKNSFSQNDLNFNFQAISFNPNQKITYRYKIKEIEKDWKQTQQTSINYYNLQPGDYTLLIQASIDGQNWNSNEIKYSFNIRENTANTKILWFILFLIPFLSIPVFIWLKKPKKKQLTHNPFDDKEKLVIVRQNGKDVKIESDSILYINSAGNYLDIVCQKKKYTIRCKIGDFLDLVPDPDQFLRIHRSYIIRIDKVEAKSKKSIIIGGYEINVSGKYLDDFKKAFD